MPQLPEPEAVIAIVVADPSVQRGLQRPIRSVGWKPVTLSIFGNAWFVREIEAWQSKRVCTEQPNSTAEFRRLRLGPCPTSLVRRKSRTLPR